MKKTVWMFGLILSSIFVTSAFAWNASYECVSNDAKKEAFTVSLLDAEIVKTHEAKADRYYRVTDSTEELIEGVILGHKVGATARMSPVEKGTMNFRLTQLDVKTITASVRVGKTTPKTYTCATGK